MMRKKHNKAKLQHVSCGVARGDPLCFLITVLAFVIIIIGRSSARPDRFDRF